MSTTSENSLGGSVGLDITDFKKGVTELKNQIKNIETGFRSSAVIMEDWGNTSTGLKERVSSLKEEINKQKQAMEIYRQELTKVSSGSEADQKAADSLTNKMYSLQKQIGYNEKDFQKFSERLTEVEKSEKQNASATGQLGKSFMDLAEKSRQSTLNIRNQFSGLKSAIAGAIVGMGITGLAKSIYSMAESASDLSEAQNVVENTFKQSSKAVEDWTNSTSKSAGIGKTAATSMVGAMGAMMKSSGITESSASTMSEKLVQLTGDMSSFYNVSTTDMWEKIRSGISGETEPLKQLGINMSVANLSAYAMSQGIKTSYDKMTQAQQTTLRYNYLLKVTSDAQGDFARTSSTSMANQSRIFKMNIQDMKQTIGTSFLPTVNSMFTAINPLFQQAIPKVSEAVQSLANNINAHKTDIISSVTSATSVVKIAFSWVENHGSLVKTAIIGIVSAVAAWKTALLAANVVQSINNAATVTAAINTGGLAAGEAALAAAKGSTTLATIALSAATIKDTAANIAHTAATAAQTAATNAARGAQILLNAALNANPIGIVITLIAALVTALVVLYKKNKTFHDWVVNSFVRVKGIARDFVSSISGFFTQTIPNAFQSAKSKITGIWSDAISGIKSKWDTFKTYLSNPALLLSAIENAFSGAVSWIKGLATEALQWGKDLIDGLINGIKSKVRELTSAVKSVASKITSFLHFSTPDEGPLADYESWMPDFMTGLAQGIESNKYKIVSAMRSLAADMSVNMSVSPAYAGGYSAPSNSSSSAAAASVAGYTFYQYNTSPKALSPSETARQTRNLLRQARLQSRK